MCVQRHERNLLNFLSFLFGENEVSLTQKVKKIGKGVCVCGGGGGGGGGRRRRKKRKEREREEKKERVNFDVFISVCSYFPSHTTFTVSIYINL